MSKEEKEKDKGNDIDDDEKEEVSWYENQQNKTANIINYGIRTGILEDEALIKKYFIQLSNLGIAA